MTSLHRPAWAVLPLCAALPLWAQTEAGPADAAAARSLPGVVVTGRQSDDASTLTQPDTATARRRISQTPGGAAVLDAADYSEGRVATLADALGRATGVFVQPRFGAEEARLSIRGSGLQRTFHGRGIKLMQDGVPLNLADGSFDFQAVEALSARHVEVWRGANALAYGASTLGGAINFVSPNGYNAEPWRVRAETGSFGYGRAQVSTGGVHGAADHYLSVSGFRQDGFRDHAKQDSRRASANLGYRLTPELETRVYLGYVHSDSELPGALTKAQLNDDPRQAQPASISADQRRDIRWTRASSKTVYRTGGHQLELFLYAADKRLHHPIFQVLDQQSRDYGAELRYELQGTLAGRPNRLALGLSSSVGKTDEDRYVNVGGASGALTNRSEQKARNVEFHIENQHEIVPRWTAVTAWQGVRSMRRLADRHMPAQDPADEGFEMHYRGSNPKLGLRWDVSPRQQAYANLSRSFEPPSFGELSGGLRPTLNDAQRATTLEVGTRGTTADVEWDVSFYEAHVRDELLQLATNTLGASQTVNAPRTLHRGLELGLKGAGWRSAAGRVEWWLTGLWNDFRFRDDPQYGNRRLPGVPRYSARAQLGYRLAGGTLLAVAAEGASAYPVDFTGSFSADRYAVWGLKASGEWHAAGLSWFVEGRNLSNRSYAATTQVVRDTRGADSAQFLPGDGRSLFAGIDWRFN
ncbi:TonB-dependent receptor family protein [Caldimonas brevitalea]|uniref:Iron complex outermembrane recepter protein n=1 Tax=Caldimonas brevitalea TaxID=413882 RepID=A0A0G3BRI2_9BURK|nr:TonB-dependent receptor [Caldimonas brevitalea]AKJ29155.1 iron complex outermembrane recepter protein [Caldimonas brevitalea]